MSTKYCNMKETSRAKEHIMVGKTHAIVGASSALAVGALFGFAPSALMIIGAAIGALVPDIDIRNSKIASLNFLTRGFSWLMRKVILPLEAFILNFLVSLLRAVGINAAEAVPSHRGPLTHSPVGVAMLALPLLAVVPYNPMLCVFILIGMISHLAVDMLNPEGIPVAYPVTAKKMRLVPRKLAVTTGTAREKGVVTAALIIAIVSAVLCPF